VTPCNLVDGYQYWLPILVTNISPSLSTLMMAAVIFSEIFHKFINLHGVIFQNFVVLKAETLRCSIEHCIVKMYWVGV